MHSLVTIFSMLIPRAGVFQVCAEAFHIRMLGVPAAFFTVYIVEHATFVRFRTVTLACFFAKCLTHGFFALLLLLIVLLVRRCQRFPTSTKQVFIRVQLQLRDRGRGGIC